MNEKIFNAINNNDLDAIKKIIDEGLDVNKLYDEEYPLLHYAVHRQKLYVIQILVSNYNADVKLADQYGRTALHYAAYSDSNIDIVKFLLHHHADINSRDNFNRTALHEATEENASEIMGCLIESGANTNIRDSFGRIAGNYIYKEEDIALAGAHEDGGSIGG